MSDMAVGARHTKENSPGSLPRSARLSKPEDFNRVFRKPTVSRDHCFKVLARINDEDQSRLGMAVSRRIDKRAVGRNRIKRVIRESFRKAFNSQSEADRQSLDIVVLPGLETATICNRALFRSLEKHWLRLDDRLRENK
jgi:ribonuclease P protein component